MVHKLIRKEFCGEKTICRCTKIQHGVTISHGETTIDVFLVSTELIEIQACRVLNVYLCVHFELRFVVYVTSVVLNDDYECDFNILRRLDRQ